MAGHGLNERMRQDRHLQTIQIVPGRGRLQPLDRDIGYAVVRQLAERVQYQRGHRRGIQLQFGNLAAQALTGRKSQPLLGDIRCRTRTCESLSVLPQRRLHGIKARHVASAIEHRIPGHQAGEASGGGRGDGHAAAQARTKGNHPVGAATPAQFVGSGGDIRNTAIPVDIRAPASGIARTVVVET